MKNVGWHKSGCLIIEDLLLLVFDIRHLISYTE